MRWAGTKRQTRDDSFQILDAPPLLSWQQLVAGTFGSVGTLEHIVHTAVNNKPEPSPRARALKRERANDGAWSKAVSPEGQKKKSCHRHLNPRYWPYS